MIAFCILKHIDKYLLQQGFSCDQESQVKLQTAKSAVMQQLRGKLGNLVFDQGFFEGFMMEHGIVRIC